MIGRITLQSTDLDRFLQQRFFDTRAFAQNFYRADTRACSSDRVRVKYHARRAHQIPTRDLLYERRYVDVRGARLYARSVVAV